MTKSDVDKLFSLLRELYPRQPQSETAERKLAWFLALEPYGYADAKEATLAHARESDYYPSVSEIVNRIPKDEKEKNNNRKQYWLDYYGKILNDEIERTGDVCHIMSDYHGNVGEIISEHCPDDCGDCRLREEHGCPFHEMKRS